MQKLQHFLRAELGFDALLQPYRVRADGIMWRMNVFLLLVCVALIPLHDTAAAVALIGLPTVALATWLWRQNAGALSTRLFMASAFMVFTGLIIHQNAGDIEAHFAAFGLIGVLLYYRDWRTVAVATVVIYLHHLLLGYAQTLGAPVAVFDDPRFWLLFGIHVAYFLPFVGMMGYLAIWLRREAVESQQVITLAQRIVQGNLVEAEAHIPAQQLANSMLIQSVLAMKSRLLDLLRVMPVASAVIRIDTQRIVSVNEAWLRTIGPMPPADQVFGESPIWANADTWRSLMQSLLRAQQKLLNKVEVVLRKADGTLMLCELSLILHDNSAPEMAILTVDDVTQRRKAERTMARLALTDTLTELPNRASLNQELASAHVRWQQSQVPYAVVMLDLDGFKPINDTHGHDVGDEVLQAVGERLTQTKRDGDFAARLGGDEFVIVLHHCGATQQAQQVAQRLIDAVRQPIVSAKGMTLQVGASAGVACVDAHSPDTEALVKRADQALYAAKHAGKNRVRGAEPTPESTAPAT